MRRAVFLDRDGTLIEEVGYLSRLDQIRPLPGTIEALWLLHERGFAAIVITNQSAVARGFIDEAFVTRAHGALDGMLAADGVTPIDAYYVCPHHPDAAIERYRRQCDCRKPGPGLIEQACRDLDIDPAHSWMIGDRWIDIGCGRAAGTRTMLVRTGYGATEETQPHDGVSADLIADTLLDGVRQIL